MSRPRVAVVGGGVFIASFAEGLAACGCGDLSLVLSARDVDRVGVVARHLSARQSVRSAGIDVSAAGIDDALDGADVVVVMVRIGGSAARRHDEEFPRRFGLVGDEGLGPGGIANTWRTVPAISDLGQRIRTLAPDATVLNLTAPLGSTTRALAGLGLGVIGVCELPGVVRARLTAAWPGGERPTLEYAGLNHAGWFWSPGRSDELRGAAIRAKLVDRQTFDRFGAVPVPYHYRVVDPDGGRGLGIVQPEGRAVQVRGIADQVLAEMATAPGRDVAALAERDMPWFEHALVPVTAAVLGRASYEGTVNVVNGTTLDWLPPGIVVEVDATIRRAGSGAAIVDPRPPDGSVPAEVRRWVGGLAAADDLAFRAARNRDEALLRRAIAGLPMPIDPSAVDGLVDAALATPSGADCDDRADAVERGVA